VRANTIIVRKRRNSRRDAGAIGNVYAMWILDAIGAGGCLLFVSAKSLSMLRGTIVRNMETRPPKCYTVEVPRATKFSESKLPKREAFSAGQNRLKQVLWGARDTRESAL